MEGGSGSSAVKLQAKGSLALRTTDDGKRMLWSGDRYEMLRLSGEISLLSGIQSLSSFQLDPEYREGDP